MIIIDLEHYHNFVTLVCLSIAKVNPKILDINEAYLAFLKPSNIFQPRVSPIVQQEEIQQTFGRTSSQSVEQQQQPKGVIFSMFKMDCLSLFGKNILELEIRTIDDTLRNAYSNLLYQKDSTT